MRDQRAYFRRLQDAAPAQTFTLRRPLPADPQSLFGESGSPRVNAPSFSHGAIRTHADLPLTDDRTFLHPHFANRIGHPLPDNFERPKAAAPVFASPLEAGPHTPARRLSSPLLILASFPLAVRPRINSASLAWAIFRTLKSAHTSSSIFQRPRRLSYASIAQRLSMP